MEHLKQLFEKHPVSASVFGIVGVLVLVLMMRGKGSAATSPSSALANATLQEQQLQAAVGVQNAQVAAQQQTSQLNAQVQNNQVNAALNAQNFQTEAGLIANLAANKTTAQANALSAEVTNNQYSTEAGIYNTQINAELAALENTNATGLAVYQTQADQQKAAYNMAYQLSLNQQQTNQSLIGQVKNIGGSQNRLALLETIAGSPQTANIAAYGQTVSDVSGDNLLSSIANAASNFASKLAAGL